jgi:hypothetical protein
LTSAGAGCRMGGGWGSWSRTCGSAPLLQQTDQLALDPVSCAYSGPASCIAFNARLYLIFTHFILVFSLPLTPDCSIHVIAHQY